MLEAGKPNILILESDIGIRELLEEKFDCDFNCESYTAIDEVFRAESKPVSEMHFKAAIIEMKDINVDELARLSQIFDNLPNIPIFLTLNYSSEYQLLEPYLKSWTDHIFFRPFNIENLADTLSYQLSKG